MKLLSIKALLVASAVCLSACDPGHDSTAGIEGTGSPATVGGTVTSYGSVYVNGIHITIDDAQVYVNGERASEEDLKLGMVVQIELEEGSTTLDGTQAADTVHYRRSLRGQVSEMPEHSDVRKVLIVLGQLLVVYDDVVFDGLQFEDVEPGMFLDVSGYNDEQGRLIAARVAIGDETSPEIRGLVANLDPDRSRFDLGALTVDYTDSLFESGERDLLIEGKWVRIIGGKQVGSVFYPDAVRIETPSFPGDADSGTAEEGRVSREGLVNGYESEDHFVVSGISVDATEAKTTGGTKSQLELGTRVVVNGVMKDGVLKADRLHLVLPGIDRVRAPVDSVNPGTGEIVVLGETYFSSSLTAYEDLAQGRHVMNLSEIYPGDIVEVHARAAEKGSIATRIKRVEGEAMSLRGPVTRKGAITFAVMGVEVSLGSALNAEVLADLRIGDRVEVTGSGTSDGFIANGISSSSLPKGRGPCPPVFELECDLTPGPATSDALPKEDKSAPKAGTPAPQ